MEETIKVLEEKTLEFMKEELKAEHSCFDISELRALETLLQAYKEDERIIEEQKEKIKELQKEKHRLACSLTSAKKKTKKEAVAELRNDEEFMKEEKENYKSSIERYKEMFDRSVKINKEVAERDNVILAEKNEEMKNKIEKWKAMYTGQCEANRILIEKLQ